MKLKIEVTQEHIDNGRCSDTKGCAIANAVISVLGYVHTYGYAILPSNAHETRTMYSAETKSYLYGDTRERIPQVPLPPIAKAKIEAFDLRYGISPFTFEIDLTDEFIDTLELPVDELLEAVNKADNFKLIEV